MAAYAFEADTAASTTPPVRVVTLTVASSSAACAPSCSRSSRSRFSLADLTGQAPTLYIDQIAEIVLDDRLSEPPVSAGGVRFANVLRGSPHGSTTTCATRGAIPSLALATRRSGARASRRTAGRPESFDAIFDDFERLIVPGITHWNHPRFFAYFAISAAPITVMAEALVAALDVNAMLWRTSPAATELEDVTLGWLREMLGLPRCFRGIVYDTASISGFTALAAARESLGLDIRARGMAGAAICRAACVHHRAHALAHREGRDRAWRRPRERRADPGRRCLLRCDPMP